MLNKSGAVAITGHLTIGDGITSATVRLAANEQIDNSVTVNQGSTFNLNGFSETIGGLEMTEGTVIIASGSVLTLEGDVDVNDSPNDVTSLIIGPGTLDFNGNGQVEFDLADDAELDVELRIGAVISSGGIYNYGLGTLALAGANTYDGETYVEYGAILVENALALGTTAGPITLDSGASVIFAGGILSIAEDFVICGDGIRSLGALRNVSGSTTLTGSIAMASNSRTGSRRIRR